MRILQVVPYSYPYAGPAKVSYGISKELAERGHKVVMYTSDMENKYLRIGSQSEDGNGIKIQYFRTLGASVTRQMKLFITPKIVSTVKEEIKNFDIIHLHEYRTFQNIVIAHYAKKHGVPYVLQAHGSLPRIVAMQKLKWIYDVLFGFRLLGDASKVIALSRMEVEQYRSMGVPEEKIAIIPNGIDLSEYANLPPKGAFKKKYGISEDEKVVLYLGRIHKIKGIDILVKAFADVIEELDNVRLVIVGPDDGYLGELETLIKASKMENNVSITRPLYGQDKLEAYVDSDVYVLPSRYEAFPMTVLEAMACRVPIILSEVCGISEVVRDNTGIVVKPSPAALAKALLKILSDENLQRRCREKCKTAIKKFNISKTVSVLEEVYEEIARQPILSMRR